MNSTTPGTKLYLGVPLGVLRRFVEMNKDYQDSFVQMFEIRPEFIFTQEDIGPNGISNGAVTINLDELYGGKNAN